MDRTLRREDLPGRILATEAEAFGLIRGTEHRPPRACRNPAGVRAQPLQAGAAGWHDATDARGRARREAVGADGRHDGSRDVRGGFRFSLFAGGADEAAPAASIRLTAAPIEVKQVFSENRIS
jgi:hypothetical protein